MEIRALTTDVEGNELYVGLTAEESAWFVRFENRDWAYRTDETVQRPSQEDRDRHQELWAHHEQARTDVIDAEHLLFTENPTRN